MEVITITISRLECFLQHFSQLSQLGQSLLQRIKDFSISAITGAELTLKQVDIQVRLWFDGVTCIVCSYSE